MDGTPLLSRRLALASDDPRYRSHLETIASLANIAMPGQERAFLLNRFLAAEAERRLAQTSQHFAYGMPPLQTINQNTTYFNPAMLPAQPTIPMPNIVSENVPFGMDQRIFTQNTALAGGQLRDFPIFPNAAAYIPGPSSSPIVNNSFINHPHMPAFMTGLSSRTLCADLGIQLSEDAIAIEAKPDDNVPCPGLRGSADPFLTDMPADMLACLENEFCGHHETPEYTQTFSEMLSDTASFTYTDSPQEEIRVSIRQNPYLIRLPQELFSAICDFLPWSAKELLSRTCSQMWKRLHFTCKEAVKNMSRDEHFQHQTDIAKTMPSHAVCADCGRIHRAIIGDVPALARRSSSLSCPVKLQKLRRSPELGCGYFLEYHHVQLALKLRRLGLLPDYVDDILQPYYVSSRGEDTYTSTEIFIRPVLTTDEQDPSFLVFRAMEFIELQCNPPKPIGPGTIQSLLICPHVSLINQEPERVRRPVLYEAIEDARMGQTTHRNYACQRCPTDISIDTQAGRLRVCVWHDLGTEGISPLDETWAANIAGPENNDFAGPRLTHANGSIRYRYERARQSQPSHRPVVEADRVISGLNLWTLHEAGQAMVRNKLQGYDAMYQNMNMNVNVNVQ